MAETLYEGPAQEATFYVPSAGMVRFDFSDPSAGIVQFDFSDPRAGGFVRSRDGGLERVRSGTRLFLPAGRYVLSLYDPKLIARVSIVFEPD
jgi:hypothetical protein